jgi:glycosyltransferase involved in cell wall biosynthesis
MPDSSRAPRTFKKEQKIRVAMLVSTLPTGGAERVTLNVLTGLDARRFDSEIYFLKEPGTIGEQLLDSGVRGFPRLWKHRYDPLVVARLARRIRSFSPHVFLILHCHRNAMFWGGLCAMFADAGARAIAVHHTGTMGSPKNFENIDRWFLSSTRAIIALSETHARYLEEIDGIDPRKITIIENGIVPENYKRTDAGKVEALRSEFGFGPGDRVVIMVAGLRPEKAHESAIEAARLLAPEKPFVRFLFVGDGPRRGELERMADALGVRDRITFAGERRDVADLLHLACALALPSHPAVETLPLAVMEAMAAGVPVIASRVGSVPDMIQDRVNGRLIAPANAQELASAIAEMVDDPAFARAIAAAGERTVKEKYTLDKMILKYTNLLEQLARTV